MTNIFPSRHTLLVGVSLLLLAACIPDNTATHSMNGEDHDSMSMDDMMTALEGKTGDDFDAAFIDMMIPHHQGAIDMAIAARESAGHAEIRAMADAIIETQQAEIDMMRAWQREWGFTE